MNVLSGMATDTSIAGEQDVINKGWQPLASAIYVFKIMAMYLGEAASGSRSVTVHLKSQTGVDVRQTLYVTSGREKGQLNYYVDSRTQEKRFNPSFLIADAICKLTVGKGVGELPTEKKIVKLRKDGKEVEEEVDMLVDVIGQDISIGLLHQIDDVKAKTGEKDANGKDIYAPTGETRPSNVIDKVFRTADMFTVPEILANKTVADFYHQWEKSWNGQVNDISKGLPGNAGAPVSGNSPLSPAATPVAASPASSATGEDNIFLSQSTQA